MVDSGYIAAKDYEAYYSKLYFDAKIELKRQQGRDERTLEQQSKEDENDENMRGVNNELSSSELANYAVLLAPFYNNNNAVHRYFDRLLQSKDPEVQGQAAMIMLKSGYAVPDSLWKSLAARDSYRARLLKLLEKAKRTDKMPAAYKTQELVARAVLMHEGGYEKLDSIVLLSTKQLRVKNKEGWVYFFKYRIKKEDDWKLGISGLQPLNKKEVSSGDELVKMTNRKIKPKDELQEQLQTELKKLIYDQHPSARSFFEDENNNVGSYQD